MNGLVFLYKKVLKVELTAKIDALRALPKKHVPVVLTKEETAAVITRLTGYPKLVVQLLYGSGLRGRAKIKSHFKGQP